MGEERNILVGVYGTLKEGFHNHAVFGDEHQHKFLEKGFIQCYGISDCGFPKATFTKKDFHKESILLEIEIYEISETSLQNLDRLEGEGSFYKRKKFNVNGKEISVYEIMEDEKEIDYNCMNGVGNETDNKHTRVGYTY